MKKRKGFLEKLVEVCYVYHYKKEKDINKFMFHLEDTEGILGLEIEKIEEIIKDSITYNKLENLFIEMKKIKKVA